MPTNNYNYFMVMCELTFLTSDTGEKGHQTLGTAQWAYTRVNISFSHITMWPVTFEHRDHTQALWKKSNVRLFAGCWCQFVILFPPLCEYLLEFRPRIFRQNYFSQLKYGALTSNGISNRCSVSLPPLSSSSSSSCITNSIITIHMKGSTFGFLWDGVGRYDELY